MRLNHVTVIASDLARSRDFYERLGFELIVLAEPRYARFVVPGNQATFSVEVTGDPPETGAGSARIFIECDDLDARVAALEAAGIHFHQPPTTMDYLWREARTRDPDGHEIRLYLAGTNRLDPPWRLRRA